MLTHTDATINEIIELENRRYSAVVAGDWDTFERLCHPEFVYTHSNAVVDTLDAYLGKGRAGFYTYHHIEHPVDRITVVGDTAIVLGQMNARLTAAGVAKTLANQCISVWVRLYGTWLLLAYQPTARP